MCIASVQFYLSAHLVFAPIHFHFNGFIFGILMRLQDFARNGVLVYEKKIAQWLSSRGLDILCITMHLVNQLNL